MSDAAFIRTKPPPLLVPSTSVNQLKLQAQAQFNTMATPEDPTYVLHLVQLPNNAGYLVAGSDDTLRTFSPALEPTAVLPSTQKGITSVVSGAGEGSTAVFVTARDGSVVGWDVRDLTKEAFKLKGQHTSPSHRWHLRCRGQLWRARRTSNQQPRLNPSFCVQANLARLAWYAPRATTWPASRLEPNCTTTKQQSSYGNSPRCRVHFTGPSQLTLSLLVCRDLRTLKCSTIYTEAHSDDLTALAFHPSPELSHVLLSGSVDGLINTYDIRVADEDDAVLTTQQIGSSVSRAGWMALPGQVQGEPLKGAWVATTIETIQLWDVNEVSWLGRIAELRLIVSVGSRLTF